MKPVLNFQLKSTQTNGEMTAWIAENCSKTDPPVNANSHFEMTRVTFYELINLSKSLQISLEYFYPHLHRRTLSQA